MRFSPAAVLLALPALTVADSQLPLFEQAQEWFASATEQVKGYIPSGLPGAVVSPIDAGASYVAGKNVEKFNINNFQQKLAPSQNGPTEWLIFVTGKNESCWGGCESANLAWNASTPLLSAIPHPPRLGVLDCDKEAVLCSGWVAGPPSLWHFLIPQAARGASSVPAGSPTGPTQLRIIPINTTTVTAQDFVKVHTEKTYLEEAEYTGAFHPVDGWVAQYGLTQPLGYVLRFFSTTPSWMIMIGISFVSRQIMSRRIGRQVDPNPRAVPAKRD